MQTVGEKLKCDNVGTTISSNADDVVAKEPCYSDKESRNKPCRLMEDAMTISTKSRITRDRNQCDEICLNKNISNIRSRFQYLRHPHLQRDSEGLKLWSENAAKKPSKTNRAPFVWTGLNSRRLISKSKPVKVTNSSEKQASDEQEISENNILHRHNKLSPTAISAPVNHVTNPVNRRLETSITKEVAPELESRRFSHSHSPLGDARQYDQWQASQQQKANTVGEQTQTLAKSLANEETPVPKPSSLSKWRFISKCSDRRLTTQRHVTLSSVSIRSGVQVLAAQKHRAGLELPEPADRLIGLIKVNNVAFEKSVIVRVTADRWKTFTDHPALYITSRNAPYSEISSTKREDTFTFQMALPRGSDRVEFAVQYTWGQPGEQTSGVDWDNNEGSNYVVIRDKLEQAKQPESDIQAHRLSGV